MPSKSLVVVYSVALPIVGLRPAVRPLRRQSSRHVYAVLPAMRTSSTPPIHIHTTITCAPAGRCRPCKSCISSLIPPTQGTWRDMIIITTISMTKKKRVASADDRNLAQYQITRGKSFRYPLYTTNFPLQLNE